MLKGKVENTSIQVEKIISVDNTNFNLKGIVHSKKANGSGYSYVIQENEEVFTALFSISNLGEDYQEFNIADSLNISGALYLDVNDLHLTVKEIL